MTIEQAQPFITIGGIIGGMLVYVLVAFLLYMLWQGFMDGNSDSN